MRVVAAVLEDASGRVLLAQRPPGKAHAGQWEFPGGKIEPGESAPDALRRELREELGIEIGPAARFMSVRRARADGTLVLEAWRTRHWHGDPTPIEHTALRWCAPDDASSLPVCEADIAIARALALPPVYAITPDPGHEVAVGFLARIETGLRRGIRLVQWRAPTLDAARYREVALALRKLTAAHGARLLLNATPELAFDLGADGVHLNAARLMALSQPFVRPDGFLVAASTHDRRELAQVAAIGADFVVISPIRATASHAQSFPIGWPGFRDLLADSDLPAFALGGLAPDDLDEARAQGALGVAGISAFW